MMTMKRDQFENEESQKLQPKMQREQSTNKPQKLIQTVMIMIIILLWSGIQSLSVVNGAVTFSPLLSTIICNAGGDSGTLQQDKCNGAQSKYRPEGPVGIRYKKQVLQNRDKKMSTFFSHMRQSAFKSKHFQAMFGLQDSKLIEEDFQLQQLCPSKLDPEGLLIKEFHFLMQDLDSQDESLNAIEEAPYCQNNHNTSDSSKGAKSNSGIQDIDQQIYLSIKSYKPKYSHIQSQPAKPESMANGGIQIQLTNNNGVEQQILQDIPKDNQYLNLALGVKPSYELPISVLDQLDNTQIVQSFLFMKAKTYNIENYNLLKEKLDGTQILNSVETFSKYTYTYEEPAYISNLTNGIRPHMIQKLKTSSAAYKYFTQDVEITPQKISFDECQLLIPKSEVIKITNKQRKRSIEIKAIVSSSPELSFLGVTFPLELQPQESIEIIVEYQSETLGLFEALMYMVLDSDYIYVSSFNAYVVPNYYDLEPIYITDMMVNQSLTLPLYIMNPSTTDTLIIEELYSSELDAQLQWPWNGSMMSELLMNQMMNESSIDDQYESVSIIQHIMVNERSKKHLANLHLSCNCSLDLTAWIHIYTSFHDIIRIPVHWHCHSDVVKFTPPIIDFGIAPLNFDIIKIPLFAKSKLNESLQILDVLLPINDGRLDFQMVDLTRNSVIMHNKESFLGYALLNPTKPGLVESKIVVQVAGKRSNRTFHIDVPIVGTIHTSPQVLGAPISQAAPSMPLPHLSFDVSDFIVVPTTSPRRKVNEPALFRSATLSAPLMITNTFKVPIRLRGLVNDNPEIKVIPYLDKLSGAQNNDKTTTSNAPQSNEMTLLPGQSVRYAQVELTLGLLKMSQGNKYMSLLVNNTLMPIAIGIYERSLLCSLDEREGDIFNLEGIPFCSSQTQEINFEYVATNDVKSKRLKITNLNPAPITIETIAKQQLDDLNVYIEKVVDKNGETLVQSTEPTELNIIGPKRTKRLINFVIQPYQTMQLVFQIIGKEPKQKYSRVDFTVQGSQSFSINYRYHVIQGSLAFIPQVIKFTPSFPGISQTKPVAVRSTFEVPVTVKQIQASDIRIMTQQLQFNIKANNKTDIGTITFDPQKQSLSIQNLISQQVQLKESSQLQFSQVLSQLDTGIPPAILQQVLNTLNGQQQQHHQFFQFLPPQQQHPFQQSQQGGPHGRAMQQALFTPQDIETYREKMRQWDQQTAETQDGSGVREITTFATIETNVYANISMPIRVQFKKLSLTTSTEDLLQESNGSQTESREKSTGDVVNFDIVQVGQQQAKSLRLTNPTDEPLVVALFLAPDNIYDQVYNNHNSKNEQTAKQSPRQGDKDYFFQTICGDRIEKYARMIKQQKIYNVPIQELNLSQKENQDALCWRVNEVLKKMNNQESREESENIRRRIEAYYKEMYIDDMQKQLKQSQHQGGINTKVNTNKGQQQQPQILGSVINGIFQPHTPSNIHNSQFDIIFYDQEIENCTNSINQHSFARPLDPQTIAILKANYERQKQVMQSGVQSGQVSSSTLFSSVPSISSIVDAGYNVMKTILIGRHSLQRSPLSNITSHIPNKNDKSRKEPKEKEKTRGSSFRLKNPLLHELIVNNDSAKFYHDMIKLSEPFMVTYTGQNFFINPKYQGQVFKVEPKSNLTIKDAIVFQPQNLHSDQMNMKLLLKNNLTLIQAIDLKGSGGTGLLEVVKVLKRHPQMSENNEDRNEINHEQYINAQTLSGHIYGALSGLLPIINGNDMIDFSNLTYNQRSRELIRERILHQVYGGGVAKTEGPQYQRDVVIRTSNRYGGTGTYPIINDDSGNIPFHITHEDIFAYRSLARQKEDSTNDFDHNANHEAMIAHRILERAVHSGNFHEFYENQKQTPLEVQTHHKRILVVQNTGNLPMDIDAISIEDKGCQSGNVEIENCQAFSLKPGEQHLLRISFKTDFTIAKLKRKITLESKQGIVQEFSVDIQLPIEYLPIANELLPLTSFEEFKNLTFKLCILGVAFACFFYVAKDCLSHIRFTNNQIQEHEERLNYIEDMPQSTKPATRREHLPPLLRDIILNEQVFQFYQQAQEKLSDRGGNRSQNQMLLLKEAANLCSNRRSFVVLDAQKQAIEAEKESRRQQQLRNISYAQEYLREQQQQRQLQLLRSTVEEHTTAQQMASNSQRAAASDSNTVQYPPVPQPAKQHQQHFQDSLKQTQYLPKKEESVQHVQDQRKYSSNQLERHPQHHSRQQESRDSIFSDLSINESGNNLVNTAENDKEEQKSEKASAASQQNVKILPKINKKLQKQLAQRLKEQQEAEERFKLQQIELKKQREQEEAAAALLREREAQRREQKRELEFKRQKELERVKQQQEAAEALAAAQAAKRREESQKSSFKSANRNEDQDQEPLIDSGSNSFRNSSQRNQETGNLELGGSAPPSVNQSMTQYDKDSHQSPVNQASTQREQIEQKKSSEKKIQNREENRSIQEYERKEIRIQADSTQQKNESQKNVIPTAEIFLNDQPAAQHPDQNLDIIDQKRNLHLKSQIAQYQNEQARNPTTRRRIVIDKSKEETSQHGNINKNKGLQYAVKSNEDNQQFYGGQQQPQYQQKGASHKHQASDASDKMQPSQTLVYQQKKQANKEEVKQTTADLGQQKKPEQSTISQLTKDDLKDFFESQKQQQEKSNLNESEALQRVTPKFEDTQQPPNQNPSSSSIKQATSPTLSAYGGFAGSIFSYNPLNFFTSNNNESNTAKNSQIHTPDHVSSMSKTQQQEPVGQIQQQILEYQQPHTLPSDFQNIEDKDYGGEDDDENEDNANDNQSNLYNVFKSASSLFSRPLFGTTNTLKQRYQQQQSKPLDYHFGGKGQESYQSKDWTSAAFEKDEGPLMTNFISRNEKRQASSRFLNSSMLNDEDEEEEEEEKQSAINNQEVEESSIFGGGASKKAAYGDQSESNNSLFGGSLFGEPPGLMGLPSMSSKPMQQSISRDPPPFGMQHPNLWNNSDYGEEESCGIQASAALRRNQQTVHPYHQQSSFNQMPYSNTMTYQYPPPPPPGLGYRPPQTHSLYAQYSGGLNYQGMYTGNTSGNSSLHNQPKQQSSNLVSAQSSLFGTKPPNMHAIPTVYDPNQQHQKMAPRNPLHSSWYQQQQQPIKAAEENVEKFKDSFSDKEGGSERKSKRSFNQDDDY